MSGKPPFKRRRSSGTYTPDDAKNKRAKLDTLEQTLVKIRKGECKLRDLHTQRSGWII
jgi:hypothetical protein